jgi:hypothetical protein
VVRLLPTRCGSFPEIGDRGATLRNWLSLLVELVLAGLPLAFSLGFVP